VYIRFFRVIRVQTILRIHAKDYFGLFFISQELMNSFEQTLLQSLKILFLQLRLENEE